MQSQKPSTSNPLHPQQPKPSTFQVSRMLTPSEIEQLRQEQNAQIDLLQKEFPNTRILRLE